MKVQVLLPGGIWIPVPLSVHGRAALPNFILLKRDGIAIAVGWRVGSLFKDLPRLPATPLLIQFS